MESFLHDVIGELPELALPGADVRNGINREDPQVLNFPIRSKNESHMVRSDYQTAAAVADTRWHERAASLCVSQRHKG